MRFVKMVASGNDFVVVESTAGVNWPKLTRKLCERKYGAGADGLLLLERSKKADIRMRIFNPDGSEVSMCGNGARCAALYIKLKTKKEKLKIETKAGILEASVRGGKIKLKMSDPKDIRMNFKLKDDHKALIAHFINTGVEHVVHFTKGLSKVDVKKLGAMIRYHKEFAPKGTNANFVEALGKNRIAVRTYERGVEDETLACGTGAVAAALAYAMKQPGGGNRISVRTKGKEVLKVSFRRDAYGIYDVYLEGRAEIIYKGRVEDV